MRRGKEGRGGEADETCGMRSGLSGCLCQRCASAVSDVLTFSCGGKDACACLCSQG